ncbi:anoctamin-4-like isoform X2 [Amphiura filiformis]|uniref:anoctamin-4-like isoform X2 n=1 Tax=Amphiura filiformis TaxID=82378 RepID=UPI003B20BD59
MASSGANYKPLLKDLALSANYPSAAEGQSSINKDPSTAEIGFEGYENQNKPVGTENIELAEGEHQPLNSDPDSAQEKELIEPEDAEAQEAKRKKETDEPSENDLFMRDGRRRIDYVIAYQKGEEGESENKKNKKRKEFEKNLREEGLELEIEDAEGVSVEQQGEEEGNSAGGKTIFIKIHVPWDTMLRYAEELKYKMPIQDNDIDEEVTLLSCLQKIPTPFELSEEFIKPEPNYFTAAFTRERISDFIMESEETFFTHAERSRVVHEILEVCRYDPDNKTKFGIEHMIANKCYAASYPLHEGPHKSEHSLLTHGPLNDRHLLYEEWARPGRWYKKQPLDAIRRYYGEKIGLYFAWLGFYTEALTWAALVGFIVFLYGCFTVAFDAVSDDLCNAGNPGNFTMCPQCSGRCPYWLLSSSCFYAKLTYLFDNGATVFFAAFMSLWATTFCEFWKRRQNEIDYDWDLFGFEDQEENCRPQFEAKAPDKRINPVTKAEEAFMSLQQRFPRITAAILTIAFMICLVLASVMGIIVYRIAVRAAIAAVSDNFISSQASIITSCTASGISLIIIMSLQILYDKIATFLTDFELHRTETDYEDSYTFKMYFFAFVNYYSSSFYIAFFKGKLPGNPSDYGKILGLRQEECDPAGCLQELFINIAIVMCGKQFFNNFMEIFVPIALNFWRSRGGRAEEKEGKGRYEQWEKDFDLSDLGPRGLFKEYLEMAVQFGFTTIFVAAFPLAPFFALVNNLMEIRLDAFKFVTQLRRPYAARAQDIGAWYAILLGVGNLAVLTNACVIAFTSEFIPREVYKYAVGEGSLSGYIDYSLARFNTSNFEMIDGETSGPNPDKYSFVYDGYPVEAGDEYYDMYANETVSECRYRGYYNGPNPPYDHTIDHWKILAMKLVFVLLYEHLIFACKFAIDYFIPDMPEHVRNAIKRENYLAQKALHDFSIQQAAEKKKAKRKGNDPGAAEAARTWVNW